MKGLKSQKFGNIAAVYRGTHLLLYEEDEIRQYLFPERSCRCSGDAAPRLRLFEQDRIGLYFIPERSWRGGASSPRFVGGCSSSKGAVWTIFERFYQLVDCLLLDKVGDRENSLASGMITRSRRCIERDCGCWAWSALKYIFETIVQPLWAAARPPDPKAFPAP